MADLVDEMAKRPTNRAGRGKVRAFADQAADQKQPRLLELLAGLFSVLNDERSAVIEGLDRFGATRRSLPRRCAATAKKLRVMQADPGCG